MLDDFAMSLASCDPLTLLPRRSSFLLALELAAAECLRVPDQMSLVLLEVAPYTGASTDKFEAAVSLVTVAKMVRLIAQRDGTVGYLAEGRFGVMLHYGLGAALSIADSLHAGLGLHFRERPVRTSIGAAASPILDAWSPSELMCLADWRLSQARQAGQRKLSSAGFDLRRPQFQSWPWI
jgi:GGDEF domain-containing protein